MQDLRLHSADPTQGTYARSCRSYGSDPATRSTAAAVDHHAGDIDHRSQGYICLPVSQQTTVRTLKHLQICCRSGISTALDSRFSTTLGSRLLSVLDRSRLSTLDSRDSTLDTGSGIWNRAASRIMLVFVNRNMKPSNISSKRNL